MGNNQLDYLFIGGSWPTKNIRLETKMEVHHIWDVLVRESVVVQTVVVCIFPLGYPMPHRQY